MASSHELKGNAFMTDAQKKMGGGALKSVFGSKKEKAKEASELYQKAAQNYKLAKAWGKAGEAYYAAGEALLVADEPHHAAVLFADASAAQQHIDPELAVKSMDRTLQIHLKAGTFDGAAKASKEMAEIYQAEGKNELAAHHHQKAADYYEADGFPVNRDNQLLKVAAVYGTMGRYLDAAPIFERVGQEGAKDKLRKFAAREWLLKAGLCLLAAGDAVALRKALDRFASFSFEWKESREEAFLGALLDATEKNDLEAFTKAVANQDRMARLEKWVTSVLVKAQAHLKDQEDDVL